MVCYSPIKGYRSQELTPKGKRKIVFTRSQALHDISVTIPCGQCRGCRLERSRQWAIRCVHEAQLHEDNCFITLTFSDEGLLRRNRELGLSDGDCSINVRDYQLFMKRLKSYVRRKHGKYRAKRIRFFHCGEYGEKLGRPHYHACLFDFDFKDKELYKVVNNNRIYVSETLLKLWSYGFHTIGDVTFESAAYVARYIMKKVTGDEAAKHYEKVDPHTGEVFAVRSEYTTMSRRPGIASRWFKTYKTDVYPSDFIVLRGVKMRPPRFYDGRFEIIDPDMFKKIKRRRKIKARLHADDNTPERLEVRRKVSEARISRLPRKLESEL